MTAAIYADTPDRVILASYLAPRRKDGRLITEWERSRPKRRRKRWRRASDKRGFKTTEELRVPDEAWSLGRPVNYTLMFWALAREHQASLGGKAPSDAEVMERFRKA